MEIFKKGMSEEEYKQVIFNKFFKDYIYKPNYGKSRIDFVIVSTKDENHHLLWAEAKNEVTKIEDMITQLVFTIKKTYFSGGIIPPAYLGVFDNEKIVIYNTKDFVDIFFRNDIDWNITPSNYKSEGFEHLKDVIETACVSRIEYKFNVKWNMEGLNEFLKNKFSVQSDIQGIEITIGNLNHIFNSWCEIVKPKINLTEEKWKEYSKQGVYPSDFFMADAYVGNTENATLIDSLKVGILGTIYLVKETKDKLDFDDESLKKVRFIDDGVAYKDFWKKYKRPPRRLKKHDRDITPWEEILSRRDVLVPRDIMERKGAFFTPRIWVEKAHEYIADALGTNWQDEYYIFDCCAGSGNLLANLYNQRNIFASDIDEQNIRIMIEETRPTFKSSIFQFDFLNDEFIRQSEGGKVPDALMDVLTDPEKRKKLIFLINPPYAEAVVKPSTGGKGGMGVVRKNGVGDSETCKRYMNLLGKASRELFAQFFARIYGEFKGCIIAEFSTLKIMQGPNFAKMRKWFQPKLLSCFLVPGNTFDNVKGSFPIGFKIWDTSFIDSCANILADVYTTSGFCSHKFLTYSSCELLNDWILSYRGSSDISLGFLVYQGSDFQKQALTSIESVLSHSWVYAALPRVILNTFSIKATVVYFATRWSVEATWLNDRDQFLYPHTDPLKDKDFINDCMVFSLFHGNNHISVEKGENHWIPFTERELGVTIAPFTHNTIQKILKERDITINSMTLSEEAKQVLNTGYEIYRYYHTGNQGKPFINSPDGTGGVYNHNAAFYDIRKFFQGTKPNGHMKVKSLDKHYQELIERLRMELKILRDKRIVEKVYEYGFLIR